jgi:hypothetical protein
MNISSVIQKHYHKRSILLVPVSIDCVRHTFVKLSTVGIIRGNLWNPFMLHYKFKVRWDGNTAHLDGPYGAKMVPLLTKIILQPSMSRDCTTLDLTMQLSILSIDISLISAFLLSIFTLCLPSKSPDKLIIFLGAIVILYGFSWIYFLYSSNLILNCLPDEFSSIDRV